MIGYASRTGSARNVAALKAAGWGWLVGPKDCGGSILAGMPWALDNGAWPAFAQGRPWDAGAFAAALDRHGPGARFIVAPDVVGERAPSLRLTTKWLPNLLGRADLAAPAILVAVQDGMAFADIEPLLAPRVGIFIGGSTAWKESAIVPWGRWAAARGIYCHVGRVNTARRISLCLAGLVDSFDGTSATRFASTLPLLDGARRQTDFAAVAHGHF